MFKEEKRTIFKVGALAALMILIIMLPSMIQNHGVYIIRGDYIDQYIPRLIKTRQILLSGEGTWDWYNYLGAPFNKINVLFSLNAVCLLFPQELIPYAVTYMHLLRFAVIAMAAYAYLNYMFKNSKRAVLGALLYTFSSYTFLNLEFMQFMEALWAFPLLLLAAEKLFRADNYKHQLVFAVFLSCTTSFYFFVFSSLSFGLYFLCRFFLSQEWRGRRSFKYFAIAITEYLIGFLCAFIVVAPFLYKTFNSAGSAESIGTKASENWLYCTDFFARLFSFFVPAASNRFNTFGWSHWKSIACYVPIFSISFTFANVFNKKAKNKAWVCVLSILSVLCMVLCGVSLIYNMLSSTYTRYSYAMIMFFVVATLAFLENYSEKLAKVFAYLTAGGFVSVLAFYYLCRWFLRDKFDVVNSLVSNISQEEVVSYTYRVFVLIAAACMFICLIAYVHSKAVRKHILPITVALLLIYGCSYTVMNLKSDYMLDYYMDSTITVKDQVDEYFFNLPEFEEGDDYRIDFPRQFRNYSYTALKPSISAFESVKNYPSIEMSRHLSMFKGKVSVFPTGTDNELRTLLGVKYYYELYPEDGLPVPKGFKYLKTENGIKIYENESYMGLGFSYSNYITRSEYDKKYKGKNAAGLMLDTLIVEDGDEAFVKDILTHGKAQKEASDRLVFDSFKATSSGFTATITAEKDEVIFVSVPYENEGWTAEINGSSAEFIKANIGCMAFKVQEGENEIVFRYRSPALSKGIIISGYGFALLAAYITICFFVKKHKK